MCLDETRYLRRFGSIILGAGVIQLVVSTALAASPQQWMLADDIPVPQPPCVAPDPDWDWLDNRSLTFYITGEREPVENIRLPYFTGEGPAGVLISGTKVDLQPDDGWVLLYKNFGQPTCSVVIPHFVLYNKYRGVIRLFYLYINSTETYTHAVAYLRQTFGPTALLTFGRTDYYYNAFNPGEVESSIHEVTPRQWSYADFAVIGYDARIPQDATLQFAIYGVDETILTAKGDVSLTQVLAPGSAGGPVNVDVDAIQAGIERGFSWFKTAQDATSSIRREAQRNPNAWWNQPNDVGERLVDLLTDSALSSLAGPIAGVAGLVSSFIFGGPTTQPLQFEGDLNITGTLTQQELIHAFTMRTPGAEISRVDDPIAPYYDKPLGIFNLLDKPEMDYSVNLVPPSDCVEDSTICGAFAARQFRSVPQLIYNPHVNATFREEMGVNYPQRMIEYGAPALLTSLYRSTDVLPPTDKLSVKVEVTPSGGTTEPVTVLNVFSVTRRNIPQLGL